MIDALALRPHFAEALDVAEKEQAALGVQVNRARFLSRALVRPHGEAIEVPYPREQWH